MRLFPLFLILQWSLVGLDPRSSLYWIGEAGLQGLKPTSIAILAILRVMHQHGAHESCHAIQHGTRSVFLKHTCTQESCTLTSTSTLRSFPLPRSRSLRVSSSPAPSHLTSTRKQCKRFYYDATWKFALLWCDACWTFERPSNNSAYCHRPTTRHKPLAAAVATIIFFRLFCLLFAGSLLPSRSSPRKLSWSPTWPPCHRSRRSGRDPWRIRWQCKHWSLYLFSSSIAFLVLLREMQKWKASTRGKYKDIWKELDIGNSKLETANGEQFGMKLKSNEVLRSGWRKKK